MVAYPTELTIALDEAGRGPLAGPVAVGAILSLQKIADPLFRDSKQLREEQRETAFKQLQTYSHEGKVWGAVGMQSANVIDEKGIMYALYQAALLAIRGVLQQYFFDHRQKKLLASRHGEDHIAAHGLARLMAQPCNRTRLQAIIACPQSVCKITSLLLDGNHTFGLEQLGLHVKTIIDGDQKVSAISCASIIAKVTRDTYMEKQAARFPHYHLETHKGYGTVNHRKAIRKRGISPLHRKSFCTNIRAKKYTAEAVSISTPRITPLKPLYKSSNKNNAKPRLLLHICCAPDLTRPLHWLKNHFELVLFWYNPNIHPRQEHTKRYEQFLKLVGLEKGDYTILEDRYDPKEFFDAMVEKKTEIDDTLTHATAKDVLKLAGAMEEWSSRCNPCYSMRLEMAAKRAAQEHIPYFTSTLLISPKKKMDKLMRRGCEAEKKYGETTFLWFDFQKNGGYDKATILTRHHGLWRQNYCGCGWTIPKPGERNEAYRGG